MDVGFRDGCAVLWIRDPKLGLVRLGERYGPDFYVEPRGVKPGQLAGLLEEHEDIRSIKVVRRACSIRGTERTVLRVRVDGVRNYRRVVSALM